MRPMQGEQQPTKRTSHCLLLRTKCKQAARRGELKSGNKGAKIGRPKTFPIRRLKRGVDDDREKLPNRAGAVAPIQTNFFKRQQTSNPFQRKVYD